VSGRVVNATPKHTAKICYYNTISSTIEVAKLLQNETELLGKYKRYLIDCEHALLRECSRIEPTAPKKLGIEMCGVVLPPNLDDQGLVFSGTPAKAKKAS
jgi:hypothetical protein